MPDLPSSVYVTVHENAASFLRAVGPWLRANEEVANTILPHSEALCANMPGLSNTYNSRKQSSDGPTVWIACWTSPPHTTLPTGRDTTSPDNTATQGQGTPQLLLLAMSGTFHLGVMPVFLFAPNGTSDVGPEGGDDPILRMIMNKIAAKMNDIVPPERIRSTFGRATLANAFATAWEAQTGQARHPLAWKRKRMLFRSLQPELPDIQTSPTEESALMKVRGVEEGDFSTVADICHRFSVDNSHHPLGLEESNAHASHLIASRQAWVYEIQDGGARVSGAGAHSSVSPGRIVSFCEIGRQSQNIAVVTKIFTFPEHRQNGYAVRLLSEVMRSLFNAGISTVVTYVTNDLPFQCIFKRTGFTEYDTEHWVEWGFNVAGGESYW